MKKILLFTITLLFGLSFISCSKDDGGLTPVLPTGVALDQTSLSLKVGETFTLTATVSPSDADNKNVKWTSLDANVASVSSGLVSAVSPGETSIIVTTEVGDRTAACKVVVEEPVIPYAGLSFVSSGTTNIALNKIGSPAEIKLEYRKSSGEWSAYTVGTSIELNDKETVSFQAAEDGNSKFSNDMANYYQFSIGGEGTVAASGNIMSLVSQDMKSVKIPSRYFFRSLFENCASLTQAPELPADTLARYCYEQMFAGCTSLTAAPELPATDLAWDCYHGMFQDCKKLTSAMELPADTLAMECYYEMFAGCTSLTAAPKLPATVFAQNCYNAMFKDCTSLTSAPELPATTLSMNCYKDMFAGCTSLTLAPALPATTLSLGCYTNMFSGCTSLTAAPELPATTLEMECYRGMFADCTNLTQAPALPATKLKFSCYMFMFAGCTSLTVAPELPATTLEYQCYSGMFSDCTSLTTAPVLPAITLETYCYDKMFDGCTKLKYVKALFTTTPSSSYTGEWLSNVASNGTFIKNPSATWDTEITRGKSTVPEGWTITNEAVSSN